MKRLIVAWSLH